ncbi:MAG TPA: S8 family serine peptidase [Planctomycetota bacterium]
MLKTLPFVALLSGAICTALSAQSQQPADGQAAPSPLRLVAGTFDPLAGEIAVPEQLRSGPAQRLWVAQFAGAPTQRGRDAIEALGGQVLRYLPEHAYVVRLDASKLDALRQQPDIRWVGAFHPLYRLEPALVAGNTFTDGRPVRYHLVVADKKNDKPNLGAKVRAIGGVIDHEQPGSLLFTVTLTGPQLLQVAGFDEVVWIDRWTPSSDDMDNARIQGGGNHVETQGGYTGTGIRAHIYEGIEATHSDFTGGATNVLSGGGADDHGHATAGIVFGNGTSNPIVRGMAPNCTKFFTQYSSVTPGSSRWQVVQTLVNTHNVNHTTASWGDVQTMQYTSVSADADDIVFDHDVTWTQSQSNTGNQNSRPQAWAKNVFSVGGVNHGNNSNPLDDSWDLGGASIGPASDGRLKPDICAYYENIGTSDRTGAAGYSANDWSPSFGGTSGATPIVAGHNVLLIEMFTDEVTPGVGLFGNPLRVTGGTVWQNRPHAPTVKALQCAGATQYAFNAASTDNRRQHQGWGFPNLQRLYDRRAQMTVIDETDVLDQGEATRYDVTVPPGEADLRVVLNYADQAALPSATKHLINNLSVRVTAPNGTTYWGNSGLTQGNWSTTGGIEDDTNPIECVFVQNPAAGVWHVDVKATLVVLDSHVETPAVDADYALVVIGGTGQVGVPPTFASFSEFGAGCPGSVPLPSFCAQLNGAGGTISTTNIAREYAYTVPSIGSAQVIGFDIFTRSTGGGTVVVPAHIYAQVGGLPAATPLASTTLTVGPTVAFYTATFASPVPVSGTFYVAMDSSAQTVLRSHLTAGSSGSAYARIPPAGAWSLSTAVTRPSWRVTCTGGAQFATPDLGNSGVPDIGGSYAVTLGSALANTPVLLVSGFSDQIYSGVPLPLPLPGAPGCNLLVAADVLFLQFASAAGTSSFPIAVPASVGLIGTQLFHQWAVFDPVNALGLVVSNAGKASIGN